MTGSFQPNSDVDRIYMRWVKGGRGIRGIRTLYESRIFSLQQHLLRNANRNEILGYVSECEQACIIRVINELLINNIHFTNRKSRRWRSHFQLKMLLCAWVTGNHHDLQSFLCSFRTLKMEKQRCREDVSKVSCVHSVSYHDNMNNHQLAAFMSFSMCINLSFYETGSFSHQNQWLKYKLLNLTHLISSFISFQLSHSVWKQQI